MLTFDEKTLDHFRAILKKNEPWGLSSLGEEMEGRVPEGIEYKLYHDLMPEIVEWFDNVTSGKTVSNLSSGPLLSIEFIMELIEHEKLMALVPFVIQIINKNKNTIIKSFLYHIKETSDLKNSPRLYTKERLDQLKKLKIAWPELDVISKGINK